VRSGMSELDLFRLAGMVQVWYMYKNMVLFAWRSMSISTSSIRSIYTINPTLSRIRDHDIQKCRAYQIDMVGKDEMIRHGWKPGKVAVIYASWKTCLMGTISMFPTR